MAITEAQRLARRRSIGSSDIPAIVCVSPFATAGDVYLSKTEEMVDIDSMPIEVGNRCESVILDWASDQLGFEIERDVHVVHSVFDFMTANLDGRGVGENSRIGIEAKTGSVGQWGEEWTDEVPDHVLAQCHWQIAVADLDMVYVPALTSNGFSLQFLMFKVDRDDEVSAEIARHGREFWENHVLPRVPPPDAAPSLDVVKRIRRVPETVADIDPDLTERFFAAKERARAAEKEAKEAQAMLLAALGDCEAGDDGGEKIWTYFEQGRRGVDTKALKAKYPEIYAEVETESRFRVLRQKKR